MQLKKIIISILSLALVSALSIAGTIAYLTYEDSDVNVMTLGNVKIKQHEYERIQNADGSYEMITSEKYGEGYKIKEFSQAKPLYPATGTIVGWGDNVYFDQIKGASGGQSVFDGLNNVQDKFVLVENTGKSDAYVRTIFAFEMGSTTAERFDEIIGISTGDFWSWNDVGIKSINGNNYYVYEAVYKGSASRHTNGVLPADEYTYNSLGQVYLASMATNEDCEDLDGNGNGTYDILVLSQAVQTAGFDDAKSALDTAFGTVVDNVVEWLKDEKIPIIVYFDVESDKDVVGLNDGSDVFVKDTVNMVTIDTNDVDGKGATVSLAGTGSDAYCYLAFAPGAGEDASVKNVNVTGSGFVEVGHYGAGGGTYTVEDLTIRNLAGTLSVIDAGHKVTAAFAHYGTATLKNCTITGTTSIAEGYKAYDLGAIHGTKTTIIGGEYGSMYLWSQAHVTIGAGAEIGEIDSCAITYKNYGKLTISSGAKVDTINLICLDAYKPALVIEEGAQVGQIIYKGVSYTQEQWMAR